MLDSQKWNKKEHTPGPRADLTPDSRRSREWHFKNAAVWLSPSRKLILGLPCFWSEIWVFLLFDVFVKEWQNVSLFCSKYLFIQLFLSNPSCCMHFSLQNAYLIYGSYFLKIFIFSIKKWLLNQKFHVFGRFFSKKATLSQKSLNLMKLLKTWSKVLKNDFFFIFGFF